MGSEEEIVKEVTCPMCMEVFRSPRLLDCMHSFCETCIKPLIAYDTGEITCPVCRHITKTANGTESLTMNLIVQNIIGAMEVISLRSEGGLTCNECDQDEAVNFCCDCYERLCDVCTGYHKRSLKFKSHVIQPLDEISRDDMSQGRIKQCPEHNEMVKFYCNSCSYTICHDCTVSKKHSGHNFELLEEITSGNKENLKLLLQSATKKNKAINKSIKEAEGIMQNIKVAKENSIMLLEETFNKIHELLNTKKTLLIKAVNKKYDEGLKSIKKAQENSQMLDDWIAFTNAVMSNKCNAEIMDIFKNLRRQLEEITVLTFMKPKALLEAEKIQKKPVVCANPNAKGRRRLSAQPQVLGLETESKTEKQEPFSPHGSLKKHNMESTKSLSKQQQQQEKVKVKTQENTVPISDVNNNKRSSESSHLNGVVNNGEQLTRKIIPVEMTPDIDTSKQIQTEIWDFHEQKYKKDVVELSQEERTRNRPRHLKKVPPPRPPPARVNSSRPLHKRRQSIPNKPTSAPPQPPVTTLPPLIRSKSQPQIYVSPRKNNQSSKRLRQPPRVPPPPPTVTTVRASTPPPIPTSPPVVTLEPISTPPLVTSPPPIKTLLNQSTSFDISEIKFPVPPSSPPSESGDDTSGYTSNSDVSILPDDGEEKGQQEEQHILEADNKLDPKKNPPPSVVPPSPAPRFFAGITMVKQDIMINEDVVNLIMETINDSCSMSSDQNSDIACSDAMFSTKEEIFQQ